jgi:hypothetical protein
VTQRTDVAALALVFTFAALLNAFAMTAPAHALTRWLAALSGIRAEAPLLAMLFLIGLVVLPILLIGSAAAATPHRAGERKRLHVTAVPYVYALVPFGVSVWLAHYGFHLLTGMWTVVPVTQSAVIDLLGWAALGEPAWSWIGMRSGPVFPIQLGFVLLGAFGSAGLVRATSGHDFPARPNRASVPWLGVVALLTSLALWILAQPMEMRGIAAFG